MAVRETGDFCKRTQDVLEDNEKNEQEGDHEREQEETNTFSQDEPHFRPTVDALEPECRLVEYWNNELLANNCQKKDAAKDSERLPE